MSTKDLAATLFYNHLDSCERCRCNPFNLCELGARLLAAAGLVHEGPADLNESLQGVHQRATGEDPCPE